MIRIGVAGVTGRMGRAIAHAVLDDKFVILSAVQTRKLNPECGQSLAEVLPHSSCQAQKLLIKPVFNPQDFDVLIDFTLADSLMSNLDFCIKHVKPMVIGTTGLTVQQRAKLTASSKAIPIMYAQNMSIGINSCYRLLSMASALLSNWEVAITDIHHKHKRDAPSGTAVKMGEVIAANSNSSAADLSFSSSRIGNVAGEHTVLFVGNGERVEIAHKADSPKIFALGAVRAAQWIFNQAAGLYDMQDVLVVEKE